MYKTFSCSVVKLESELGERFFLPSPLCLLSFFLTPSSPLPLPPQRSRPLYIQLGGLGEHCKLPQQGLGRSPSRNRISCILALKSDIWWQQF